MRLKKFNNFINEDITDIYDKEVGDKILYRLTSHPVIDLVSPGEYYVDTLDAIDPSLLKNPSDSLFLITVKCDSSNINEEESEKESAKLGNDNVIVVKEDSACEVISVEPYKNK
jgi:hypothetical protein